MSRSLILDLIVGSTVLAACWRGWARKSVRETFALLALAVGIGLVAIGTGPVGRLIAATTPADPNPARAIAAGVLLGLTLLVGAIVGFRVARSSPIPGPRMLDSIGGVAFAFVRVLVVVALALFCLDVVWLPGSDGNQMITSSVSGELLEDEDSLFGGFFTSLTEGSRDLDRLVEWASSPESSDVGYKESELRATDASLALREESERAMLALINSERRASGLSPLMWCARCAEVARMHSRNMYRNGFFAHEDLSGDSPFDRMQDARIEYAAAGENLALAPTVDEAHQGLMGSADHRANILRGVFDEVGIGIYEGPYGLMCTQVFRSLP